MLTDHDQPALPERSGDQAPKPMEPAVTNESSQGTLNPWFSILLRPRKTIRQILDADPFDHVYAITISATAMQLFMIASAMTGRFSMLLIAGISAVTGAIVGLIVLHLFGWLFGVAGRLLGGQGENADVRAAIAWAQTPMLYTFAVWLIAFAGQQLLIKHAGAASWTSLIVYGSGFVMGNYVTPLWSFILMLLTIAEAHRFSVIRSFVATIIGYVAVMIPIAVIGIILAIAIPGLSKLGALRPRQGDPAMTRRADMPTKVPALLPRTDVKLQIAPGKVILNDGSVLEGRIMYEDNQSVYVETAERVVNLEKNQVQEVVRGDT